MVDVNTDEEIVEGQEVVNIKMIKEHVKFAVDPDFVNMEKIREVHIEKPVIKGRVTIVIILTTAVYDMDNAVSPLASLVIIFEVTPPGHDASIIIPTAISFVKPIK